MASQTLDLLSLMDDELSVNSSRPGSRRRRAESKRADAPDDDGLSFARTRAGSPSLGRQSVPDWLPGGLDAKIQQKLDRAAVEVSSDEGKNQVLRPRVSKRRDHQREGKGDKEKRNAEKDRKGRRRRGGRRGGGTGRHSKAKQPASLEESWESLEQFNKTNLGRKLETVTSQGHVSTHAIEGRRPRSAGNDVHFVNIVEEQKKGGDEGAPKEGDRLFTIKEVPAGRGRRTHKLVAPAPACA